MGKTFVRIGNTQIKKSNIKSFGIGKSNTEPGGLIGAIVWGIKKESISEGIKVGISGMEKRYLYVTTYQGDNYTFSANEIDIDATMELLENI